MKTVTGLFDDYEDASEAVGQLEALGIPISDISIVASNSTGWYDDKGDSSKIAEGAAGGAGIGAVIGGAGGLLAGLGLIAIPGVGPVVAAGWLAATAVGALTVGAAGGIVGALTKSGVPEEDAHVYAEGIRRGGTLVTTRVSDDLATEAEEILGEANSVNVDERRTSYKEGGWSSFDPDADLYTADEIADERAKPANRL